MTNTELVFELEQMQLQYVYGTDGAIEVPYLGKVFYAEEIASSEEFRDAVKGIIDSMLEDASIDLDIARDRLNRVRSLSDITLSAIREAQFVKNFFAAFKAGWGEDVNKKAFKICFRTGHIFVISRGVIERPFMKVEFECKNTSLNEVFVRGVAARYGLEDILIFQ